MTYFLNDQPPADTLAPRGNDLPLSSFLQGLGAGTRKAMLEHDANMIARRTTLHVQDDVAIQAGKLLGMDRVKSLIEEQNAKAIEMGMPSQVRDMPTSIDEIPTLMGPNFSKKLLEIAREDATANPAKWQGIDLSQEGIDTETNTRLQAEHREQQDTLDMMPSGRGAAETIGGIAAFAADAKNWPFLVAGGGEGALLKVLGREAMWNAALEAINLPAEFDMAKKLDKPDPNIGEHLLTAAVGGAVIGGGIHALGRALTYYRGRGRTSEVAGYGRDSSETIVSAAENAITKGEDPIAAASRAIAALPTEPPPSRPPLITESRLPPVDGQVPEPLPDSVIANQAENAIADAESAFAADFPEMRHKNPLAKKVQTMGGVQASRINPATGAKEMTPAAQELAAMGVTTKTHPFLFRNKGMADLDNIPAADHLGLAEVLKVDPATGYFDRQDMLSALARELTTGKKTAMTGEIAARMAEIEHNAGIDPNVSPAKDFASGQESPTGWFVQKGAYDMFPDGDMMLRNSFEKYLGDVWPGVRFTDAERAEMLHELQTRGGDAEYLVSRTLERDLEFVDLPKAEAEKYDWIPGFDEPTAQGLSRQSGESVGGPGQVGPATRGGAEGYRRSEVVEPTAAGEQFVAPGIEPVTQRQRLEARQETPMRGSARPMDDGLFDLGARQQIDMFSDPASAEARPILDTMTADIRDEITKGDDFLIDMGDGKGERMASTVLDDLDKGDAAAARFDLCGRGPA